MGGMAFRTRINLAASLGPITDNFNRANSTTTLGSPWATFGTGTSTSNNWNTSTWGVSSNTAYLTAVPSDGFGTTATGIAYVDPGTGDGQLDLDLTTVSSLQEIAAFRIDPQLSTPNNRSLFFLTTNQLFWLGAGAGGTALVSFSTVFGSGDHLTIVLAGSSITVKRNGSTVATRTDTRNQAVTKHGLAAGNTTNRYDNFSWTP